MAITGTRVLCAAGAIVVTAMLSGCVSDAAPPPSPSTSASETTAAPSPTTSESGGSSSAELPTDCNALGTPASRDEAVGDMTLQSDGEGFVRPAPDGAALQLGCDWIVGDATGMLLLISTATPDAVAAAVAELPAQGYTCQVSDDFGADFCQLPGEGLETEELIVAREDVWIYLSTSNRNGRAFLSDIVQGIFG